MVKRPIFEVNLKPIKNYIAGAAQPVHHWCSGMVRAPTATSSLTGIGPVAVRQPRVRDREAAEGERIRYSPSIVPPYARRSKSLEVLIPVLYRKGISSGDFEEALAALVGKDAPGLSASTIARLKEVWTEEHAHWQKRDLSAKRYVYCWADGIHLEARLEQQAQCILVIIGATPEGKKELIGFTDGMRESAQSWRDLLLDLKRRGLTTAPQIAVADGALGFWKALGEVWPTTREQRCWVHKTANILNKQCQMNTHPHCRTSPPTGIGGQSMPGGITTNSHTGFAASRPSAGFRIPSANCWISPGATMPEPIGSAAGIGPRAER